MKQQSRALKRRMLRLVRQLGEIVNASATYLGIAVMVIAASSVLLQPVRDQVRQAYTAALQSLDPSSDGQTFSDLARWFRDADWTNAASRAGASDGAEDASGLDADDVVVVTIEPGTPIVLEDLQRDFDRMLVDRPDALAITGISATQFQALRRYLSRKYRIAQNVAGALIQTAYVLGLSQEVDPQLLLAIIAIESSYNPFAESHVGAQGLMQVMPRVHRDKFEALGLDIAAAVEPMPNMIVGTQVYRDCRRRRGSVTGALSCYVGATGPSDGGYGAKVLAERWRIARASGIALLAD